MPSRAQPAGQVAHFEADTPERMRCLGAGLGRALRAGDLVILDGDLGAGKTTFTQGLGEQLGVRGAVSSPTYIIARVHPGQRVNLIHVDAYRLSGGGELEDLDLDTGRAVTVVEWGKGLAEVLNDSYLLIKIVRSRGIENPQNSQDERRSVIIEAVGPRWLEAGAWAEIEALGARC